MALLAGLLMATNVMGIQLGHFFAMDTFLVMFMVASFWSMLRLLKLELKTSWSTKLIQATLTAIFFGLALSAKISAILFAPILALMYLQGTLRKIHWKEWLIGGGWILMISLLTLRLGQPYLFAGTGDDFWRLNQKVIDNWKMLKTYDDPTPLFPPATQWINTTPYVFPLINFSLFSMGIAWALIGFISLSRIGVLIKQKQWGLVWSAIWVIGLFIYQGGQFAKAMRYLYPLIPFLVILMAETVMVSKKGWGWFMKILLLTGLLWPLMFVKIYTRPPSRLAASEWMYQSIPRGSKITCDYWDDCLPLPIGKKTHTWFKILELHPYDLPDDTAKIRRLAEVLEQTDFWVMSSNRLFAAITSVPEKHPLTSNMYQLLFDGKLGFTKVAEFTSRPGINFLIKPWCLTPPLADYGLVAKASQECNEPGLTVVDDYAEESFTVYDHPKVLIFQKTASLKTNDYVKMVAGGQ